MMKKTLILLLAALSLSVGLAASESVESSPWIGWRKGYEYYDKAGAFREENNLHKALEFYTRSRDYFAAIKKHFPNWNSSVVDGRIRLCENEIAAVKKLLAQPAGERSSDISRRPNQGMPPVHGSDVSSERVGRDRPRQRYEYDPQLRAYDNRGSNQGYSDYGGRENSGNSGRLYIEMQSEIDQYRKRLRNALMEIDSLQIKLRRSEARERDIDGVLRDYRLLQEKYSMLEMQYKNAQARSYGVDRERHERQLVELKLANEKLQKQVRKLEEDSGRKDEEFARSRNEVLKLREDIQGAANEKRRLQRELELQRNKLAASGSADAQEKVRSLENTVKRQDERISRLMEILNSTPGSGTSAAASAEIKRLQSEVDQLRKNSDTADRLQRRIADLLANEKSLKSQLAESSELLELRGRELRAMRGSEIKLQQSLGKSQTEVDTLKKRVEELTLALNKSANSYNAAVSSRSNRLAVDAEHNAKLLKARQVAEDKLVKAQQELKRRSDEAGDLRKELTALQGLVKSSRTAVIELKARQHSQEIELKKMVELQKAYDELKARFDVIRRNASGSDVLAALNRIPGLEESLRRYEKENSNLLKEIAGLKKALTPAGGKTPGNIKIADLEKLETLLAEARSAETRGNLEVAVWGYRQVLGRDGKNQQALVNLGNIWLRRGKFDDAADLFAQALPAAPGDVKLVNSYCRSLIGRKDYKNALKKVAEFKKAYPKSIDSALALTEAVAWSRSGKNSAAEKSFKEVLKLEPGNAEAAYELSLMLSADEKRRREAAEYYLLAKNNGGEVDSYLEDLLRSFSGPDLATRDFLLGNVIEALNKNDMAQSAWYLSEIKRLYANDKEYLFAQSMHDVLTNNSAAAIKRLQKFSDARSLWLCALALRQTGEYDKAAAVLVKLGKLPAGTVIEAVKKFAADNPDKKNKKAQQITAALMAKLP